MKTELHTSSAFATGQPGAAELAIDPALVEQILVRFLHAEIHRTGFRRAVVGVSGGINSSVVVSLAARALGPENVLAVTMPYKTSSDETRRDSQAMIAAAGRGHARRADQRSDRRLFRPLPRSGADAAGQQMRPGADDDSV